MIVLGIETSCDETGMALVKDGTDNIAESLVTQIDLHSSYGGVVPELAARQHSESISFVYDDVLSKTDLTINDVDGIAITYGPGLPGALLVGISFAKSLAYAIGKPLIPVNHIEAHLFSINIEFDKQMEYPALGLVVSGGHTSLFEIEKPGMYRLLAKTRDDAAGEAYDKAAKLMNLGYPGGPVIDKLAKLGDNKRFRFKEPKFSDGSHDFSFSGIKTAVLKIVRENEQEVQSDRFKQDLAASFQSSVVKILLKSLERAFVPGKHKSIFITGGVAVNSELREKALLLEEKLQANVLMPSGKFCTDNGVMIAALGCEKLNQGIVADLTLDAEPNLKLGE